MLQPTRCRSDEHMAQILSERLPCNHLQVIHFRIAGNFDGALVFVVLWTSTPQVI